MVARSGRIYDPPRSNDGARILVDRLWPRGVSKEAAALDWWCRAVAPSNELRKWYKHDPAKFDEFLARFRRELTESERAEALGELVRWGASGDVLLLTATKAVEISHAAVLAEMLNDAPS